MKKKVLKMSLLMMAMVVVGNMTFAQSKKEIDASDLVGTWEMDFHKSIQEIKSTSRAHYDQLKQEKRNRIRDSFSQRKVTFGEDGSYLLNVRSDRQVSGTWEMLDDGVTLLLILEGGEQAHQTIEKLNFMFLTLNLGEDDSSNRLFDKWSLKRSKN